MRWHHELFTLALLLLESHYLRHYDASFAENFYGLKRRPALQQSAAEAEGVPSRAAALGVSVVAAVTPRPGLSGRQKVAALFFLVLVPYLKAKLDAAYAHLTPLPLLNRPAELDHEPSGRSGRAGEEAEDAGGRWRAVREAVRAAFLRAYPTASALYEALFFVYALLYLYERTRFFTPLLHLLGQEVVRLSPEELALQAQRAALRREAAVAQVGAVPGLLGLALRAGLRALQLALDSSHFLLPLAIFAFKFLEWWYTESRAHKAALPCPPPPEPPVRPAHPLAMELPADRALCPICRQPRTNAALLAASGLVYCYPCIFAYVQQHRRCPVTLLPAHEDQVRKIYEVR